MDRIDAKEKLKELTDQAYEILKSAYGPEADLYISVSKRKCVEIRLWGEPDETGDFTNTPRRDILCINGGKNGWDVDLTESNNAWYKMNGILLEVEA